MTAKKLKPKQALNKAFLKKCVNREELADFSLNLSKLLTQINEGESEEFHKNLVADFLKDTYYKSRYYINTRGRNDLVIHNGSDSASKVGVIFEVKKPTNKPEMMTAARLNSKAFHELVLYYLRERITHGNIEVRHLIASNVNEWFIFDSAVFERLFVQNKTIARQFQDFESGRLADTRTEFFYKQIAEPYINEILSEIEYTHFDTQEFRGAEIGELHEVDESLINLFKILSPEHLLKLPFNNDSNVLDKNFYNELLHIIGLTETKVNGKLLIGRKKETDRDPGAIIEDAIIQLDSLDKLNQIQQPKQYGSTYQEQLFNVALELTISWINRVLFLKLLEAQLGAYHKGNKGYLFLNTDLIQSYGDLNRLFFQVLARKSSDRNQDVKSVYAKVPYLNSSLFDPTNLEQSTIFISNLQTASTLPVYSQSVLKDETGKRLLGSLPTLSYLLKFLDAYSFTNEGLDELVEDNRQLISASVLGLLFEKINGYKDGSYFTPGFITMYICRHTIRKAVVQKFRDSLKDTSIESIAHIYELIPDKVTRAEANELINSLKICDPAVGSGHFLVSALNEVLAIKNDLKILQDRDGKLLHRYEIAVENDELIITDEDGNLFQYNPTQKESQRIQEAIFHEKQHLIENCLFGVDINPNSVQICRLRLWIELLKSAYYKNSEELETLPNIDINIKCGNSLISRFDVFTDLRAALKQSKLSIKAYRDAVSSYRNANSKDEKRDMEKLIVDIKSSLRSEITAGDPIVKKLKKMEGELFTLTNQFELIEMSPRQKQDQDNRISLLGQEIASLKLQIEQRKANKIFENALEWRFEFPEVLSDEGEYIGFDVLIGNPPYISAVNMRRSKLVKDYFKVKYPLATGSYDIYTLFVALTLQLAKSKGSYSYIIPNKFLVAEYSRQLYNKLLEDGSIQYAINLSQYNIFEAASVYPIIISGELDSRLGFDKYKVSSIDDFMRGSFACEAALKSYSTVKDAGFQVQSGLAGFQASSIIEFLSGTSGDGLIPFTVSGCIDRYVVSNRNVRYMKSRYDNAHISLNCGLSRSKIDFWTKPKVVIAGMTKVVEAVFVSEPYALGVGIYGIQCVTGRQAQALAAILNSKFISFYFTNKFREKELSGGYLAINKNTIEQIPWINPPDNIMDQISDLSINIHSAKRVDPATDTSAMERLVDELVYSVYGLEQDEISEIEGWSVGG
jgi:adenine-specific DNA-methyltransferase